MIYLKRRLNMPNKQKAIDDLEDRTHFWGLVDGALAVLLKRKGRYFICGDWGCSIPENQIEFIEVINQPEFCREELYF